MLTLFMVDVPSDGACFLHCLVAFAQDYRERDIRCSVIPTEVQQIRREICDFLVENRDNPIFVGGTTPFKRIKKTYFPKSGHRDSIIDSDYNKRVVDAGLSIAAYPYCVSTFDEYIEAMMNPHAFADEIFVEAAGILYNLKLSVFSEMNPNVHAPIHEKTDDDLLDILVEQGFNVELAKLALLKVNRDLQKAIDDLCSQPQLSSEPSEKPPPMFHCQSYNIDDGIYPITILNNQNHYQLILGTICNHTVQAPPALSCGGYSEGGSAAFSAQPAPSSRTPSAGGGGAAAVPAQTSPSSRTPSAGGGAAVPHQSPPSFGHAQPTFESPFVISARSLYDSVFSKPDGFFRAIQQIFEKKGECPEHFKVTGLNIPSSCAQSIQLYGSFPVSTSTKDPENYYPCRGTKFVFGDGSFRKYDGSVDTLSIPENKTNFSEEILKYWRDSNRVLVEIHFERCALKQIPRE
jgi:hypothetical protein